MAKITIMRPQSNGTLLYGSLREHRSFVEIAINLDNAGAEAASCLIGDKIGLLESEGRLPAGSLEQFQAGGGASAAFLPGAEAPAQLSIDSK